jgi:hypothetical protein
MAGIEEYNLYTYTLTISNIDSGLSVGPQSNTIVAFYYRFFRLLVAAKSFLVKQKNMLMCQETNMVLQMRQTTLESGIACEENPYAKSFVTRDKSLSVAAREQSC